MFLVKDRRLGMDIYVLAHTDPRADGYKGEVTEDVSLEYDMNAIHLWPDGEPRPDPRVGRDPNNPKHFKVFKFPDELKAAGFELVSANTPIVVYSWADYRRRFFPVPEEYAQRMSQEEWFDYLDEADTAAKIRKNMTKLVEPKPGNTRDQVAEWVAKRHMGADSGIQSVWFLPDNSSPNEIRLLEVSERHTADNGTVETFDFGLDVAGTKYRLVVADVNPNQLEKIKTVPTRTLPNGWTISGAKSWGRRK